MWMAPHGAVAVWDEQSLVLVGSHCELQPTHTTVCMCTCILGRDMHKIKNGGRAPVVPTPLKCKLQLKDVTGLGTASVTEILVKLKGCG